MCLCRRLQAFHQANVYPQRHAVQHSEMKPFAFCRQSGSSIATFPIAFVFLVC